MARRNAPPGKAATTAAVFGELLRHLRESAGLTQAALARRIPCDRSYVTHVEAGTRVPQNTFARRCDEILHTGGTLTHLWRGIDWYPAVEHPDWFQRRADMEEDAVAVFVYQIDVVQGLLQTEEYARALFSLAIESEEKVEDMVRARMSRQRRFLADDGPLLVQVIDESCLRRVTGGARVMRDQCAHLLELARRPNIRIQVAPADAHHLVRPFLSMSLISLPDGSRVLYSESLDRGHFIEDPEVIAQHARTYDVLRADAPSAGESAEIIRRIMEEYGRHDTAHRTRALGQEQLQPGQRRRLRGGRPRYPRHRLRPRQQGT
ncbi:Scr1 family TA system antitoxin-like transcriptional regulator [Streptomyces sp. NPDC059740]|uniref:helix-turn-helix domain-containing protein n=1 Tax=Streptomyces sp. NPDC059740 TaxID=3346926 RepID=UPI003653111A